MIFLLPLLEGVVDLTALLLWVAAFFLLLTWRSTIGAAINGLFNALNTVGVPTPFGTIGVGTVLVGPLEITSSAIEAALGVIVDAGGYAWHKLFHQLAAAFTWTGEAVAYCIHEVEKGFTSLVNVTIPRLAGDAVKLATHPLRFAEAGLQRDLTAAEKTISADVTAVERAAALTERVALARIARLQSDAVAVPHEIEHLVFPRLDALEKEVRENIAKVRGLAKYLTPAGIVGLVTAAIVSEFGFLRCNNTRSFLKHLCSWPVKLLEDMLGGVLDYLVLTNICYLLTEMQTLAVKMLPYIEDGTGVIDQVIGCQKSTIAADIPVYYTSVPSSWASLPL